MKKIIFSLVAFIIIVGFVIFAFTDKKNSDLTNVKVAEVTHSVFYAPQYVAHALGYFEEEGLDVEIILTAGGTMKSDSMLYNKLTAYEYGSFNFQIYK